MAAGTIAGVGALVGASEARAEDFLQWPLGTCVEGKLVAGHGIAVLQDYNVDNDYVGRCSPGDLGLACRHAGVDLWQDDNQTFNAFVYAMSDGEVAELISWNTHGQGVLVRHDDGTVAHYVHLNTIFVERGEPVRQGQPIGRVMSYPDGADHLHLEVRTAADMKVRTCDNTANTAQCNEADDFTLECKGNGYSLDQRGAATPDANTYGFGDPIDAYFGARPPFPVQIAADPGVAYYSSQSAENRVGDLVSGQLYNAPVAPSATASTAWYGVDLPGDPATYYAQGLWDINGDELGIGLGEVPAIGGDWTPPVEQPMLDLRFLPGEQGSVRNYGWDGGAATPAGALLIEPPYQELGFEYCDQVGRVAVTDRLEYTATGESSFADGVAFDLDLYLDAFDSTDDAVVLRGGDADHTTWQLVVRVDEQTMRRQLAFQVTLAQEVTGGGDDGAGDDGGGTTGDTGTTGGTAGADEAPTYEVRELVLDLDEPRCRAEAAPASCTDANGDLEADVLRSPAACALTASCDPSNTAVERHCFIDFGYRQWRNVAARYDVGTGQFELLIDGEGTTGSTEGALQPPEGTMVVVAGEGVGAAFDDVRVWDLSHIDEGDKGDEIDDDLGGIPRGQEQGCSCQAGSSGSGLGGTALLLLGLWGLRRRRLGA